MPEFILDKSGTVTLPGKQVASRSPYEPMTWPDLDAFTQGYIEALFFTSGNESGTLEGPDADEDGQGNDTPVAFSDLAPTTLAAILADCAAFQASRAWADTLEDYSGADEVDAGRDFWLTRNGHGAGFWDGDWPEPHATALTDAAKAFGSRDAYLGDDGKVYLS